jgi:murein L,D-transpeptidase YcbB/YkuD
MSKPDLTKLLERQAEPPAPPQPTSNQPTTRTATKPKVIHKPGEVNISAYFAPEVKSAIRQVQAKTGKNIKGCLSEALQLLFRKYNVPVTVPED